MTQTRRKQMSDIMLSAWNIAKKNSLTISDALKRAWRNASLKARLTMGIVEFTFRKIDGTIRKACGTLKTELLPPMKREGGTKSNENVQVYFDIEKQMFRSFRKSNLITIL